jgi:membrane associated rhomboid family serine protease
MAAVSCLGLFGIAGAWIRLGNTQSSLSDNPLRRAWALGLLGCGIVAALLIAIFSRQFADTRSYTLVMVAAAIAGVFLFWVTMPTKSNRTIEKDAGKSGARPSL